MKKILLTLSVLSQLIYAQSNYFKPFNTHTKDKVLRDKYCQNNSKGEEFCNDNSFTYPILKTKNEKLKQNIDNIVGKYIKKFKKSSAKADVISTLKDMPDISLSYEDTTTIELHALTKNTFTLSVSNYNFTGGAHGNYSTQYYNYNIQDGTEVGLKNILISGYSKRLKKIAEKAYRDDNNYMPDEDLSTLGWFKNEFEMTDNYAIGSDGLEFLYNPYEIKPYAGGTTSFTIPYEKLNPIMKPNSLISKPTKKSVDSKTTKYTLKSLKGEIEIESTKLNYNSIELKMTMKNLSTNKKGWFSISFPQITSKKSIKSLKDSGFKKVTSYNKGEKLYNFQLKKGIKSKYLLIEGESLSWARNSSKSITTTLQIPRGIKNLYINLRGSYKTAKGVVAFPNYGDNMNIMEGQQGFENYRVKINIKK
jgi:hypothetical protein